MEPVSRRLVNVSVSIQLEFYYHEYDWGVIYREIGGGDNSKFYKVFEMLSTRPGVDKDKVKPKVWLSTPYRLTKEQCWTAPLFYTGDLHLIPPALNLSALILVSVPLVWV